jgi:hypothetical protein
MADDEARLDGVLAADDVQVRAANGGERDADDGLPGSRAWPLDFFDSEG